MINFSLLKNIRKFFENYHVESVYLGLYHSENWHWRFRKINITQVISMSSHNTVKFMDYL